MLRLESADFAFDLESQIQVSCCQQVVVDESIESTLSAEEFIGMVNINVMNRLAFFKKW